MSDNTGHHLSTHECWAMLRTATVGRLGFALDRYPEIFPLNFAVDQDTIVFRASRSSRVALCLDGRNVAFEADGFTDAQAWSVVVKGHAKEIRALDESSAAAELWGQPLPAGSESQFVRIAPDALTGRRFTVAAPRQSVPGSGPHSAPE